MTFVDMPDRRFQAQFLQRAHTADTQHDLLLDAHHLVTAIQTMRDVAIVRAVAFQIGVQQVQRDMANPGLPNLDIELAPRQIHRCKGLGTISTMGRNDGHVIKIGVAVGSDLIAFAVYGLMKISLAIQQTDTDERQPQITCSLAVIARQDAQAARVDRETFVKTELGAEISDQILFAQPVRSASRQPVIVVSVIICQYTVEITDEYLVICRIQQTLLVHTLKKTLGLCPVAFHRPGCRLANSARVGRSQLYQRLFASSSRRARRAGIFGRTCKMYAVLLFMGRLCSKYSKLCLCGILDYSATAPYS